MCTRNNGQLGRRDLCEVAVISGGISSSSGSSDSRDNHCYGYHCQRCCSQ